MPYEYSAICSFPCNLCIDISHKGSKCGTKTGSAMDQVEAGEVSVQANRSAQRDLEEAAQAKADQGKIIINFHLKTQKLVNNEM